MLLAKTDKARSALQARDPALGMLERRILIISDGLRSVDEIAALLGPSAEPAIDRLLREGYLQPPADARVSLAGSASTTSAAAVARSAPATAMPPAIAAKASSPTTPAAVAAPTSSGNRRSLIAARMYMLDILQLPRGLDTAPLQSALRAAREPHDTLAALYVALRELEASASPSFSERVRARLLEVLPVEHLDAWMRTMAGARPDEPVTQSANAA